MSTRNPDKLFKYCSVEAAKSILKNSALRWSSPCLFGDPFEANHNMAVNFDRETLLTNAIKLSSGMIFASDNPRGDTPIINAIKRWRGEERFSTPEEAEIVLRELLAKMVDQRMENFEEFLSSWREYTKSVRVCCFSSRPDNPVAWDQFADRHRGICLRFNCEPGAYLCQPKPVEYKHARPAIATLKQQIDGILYNLSSASPDFESLLTVNSLARKLEQEWRCFRQSTLNRISEDESTWFEDYPFDKEEVSALCFGVATSDQDKLELEKLVKANFPSMRCFQASLSYGKYELEIQKTNSAA